jgi:proteasome lid subunit RPN8/RPN11
VNPIEACALLFGYLNKQEAIVKKVVIKRNELNSSERFEINPECVFKAFNEAEKEGLDFVGLFHSHTASAIPSIIDLKFMKIWGDAVWLILSLADDNFACFQIDDGELKEIEIEIGM